MCLHISFDSIEQSLFDSQYVKEMENQSNKPFLNWECPSTQCSSGMLIHFYVKVYSEDVPDIKLYTQESSSRDHLSNF